MTRVTTSGLLPAAAGVMKVTGLVGQPCACADRLAAIVMAATQTAPNLNPRIRIDRSSMSWIFTPHASGRSPSRRHQRQPRSAFAKILNERSEKTRFLNANFAPLSMWYVTLLPIFKEGFMLVRSAAFWATTLGAMLLVVTVSSAHALTMKECSAKYKAAQDSGTLKGMKWNDFRKAECGI